MGILMLCEMETKNFNEKIRKKTFFIKLVTWLLQKHSQVSFEKVNGWIFVI
jgi:hypothetical protein